jgi:hypothetical protein
MTKTGTSCPSDVTDDEWEVVVSFETHGRRRATASLLPAVGLQRIEICRQNGLPVAMSSQ